MKKNGSPTDANVNGCAAQRQKKNGLNQNKTTVIGASDNGTNDR